MFVAALAFLTSPAVAGDRQPLPARWVERPLVVPRGWTRVELAGVGGRDDVLSTMTSAGPTRRDMLQLSVGHGLLPRVELFVEAAMVRATQGDLTVWGMADPEIGARLELHRREAPNRTLALQLSASSPHGALREQIALGLGQPTFSARFMGRRQLGPMGVDAAFGGTVRPPGPLPARQLDRSDLADELLATASAFLVAGPLVLQGGSTARWRSRSILEGLTDELAGLEPANGVDVELLARLQLTRGADLLASWTWPVSSAPPLPGELSGRRLRIAMGVSL